MTQPRLQESITIKRDTAAALIVVVQAVRDERLGLRALDEVVDRLTLALKAVQ